MQDFVGITCAGELSADERCSTCSTMGDAEVMQAQHEKCSTTTP